VKSESISVHLQLKKRPNKFCCPRRCVKTSFGDSKAWEGE